MGLFIEGKPGDIVCASSMLVMLGTYADAEHEFVCDVVYDMDDPALSYYICVAPLRKPTAIGGFNGSMGVWTNGTAPHAKAIQLSYLTKRSVPESAFNAVMAWARQAKTKLNIED